MRINRFLAQCGLGSRRSVEALVAQGKVVINGEVVRRMATRVDTENDVVEVDGRRAEIPAERIYLALNKPAGFDVTRGDPHAEATVYDLLPADLSPAVQAVGRLDRPTTGLLLLTNDGDLNFRLTHPRHGVEKEYLACGPVSARREQIEALIEGVRLGDGMARALEAEDLGEQAAGGRKQFAIRLVMHEGRKRIVRRMLEAVGFELASLRRPRVGPIELGDLPEGEHRALTAVEVEALRSAAKVEALRRAAGDGD